MGYNIIVPGSINPSPLRPLASQRGYLPRVGVSGYTHRYRASGLTAAVGSAIDSIANELNPASLLGVLPATDPTANTAPTHAKMTAAVSGETYDVIDTSGSGAASKSGLVAKNVPFANGATVAVVLAIRGTTQSVGIATLAGRTIRLNQNGTTKYWQVYTAVGTATDIKLDTSVVAPSGDAVTLHLVVASLSQTGATDTLYAKKGPSSGSVTGPVMPAVTSTGQGYFALGKNGLVGSAGANDGALIVESIVWPRALSATEISTISGYASRQYPGL